MVKELAKTAETFAGVMLLEALEREWPYDNGEGYEYTEEEWDLLRGEIYDIAQKFIQSES